jgi:two-component system chemotaxis response regulator CheB
VRAADRRGGATGAGRRPVRVLVVDDSHFVRRALARLLASDARVEVVGDAASGVEAVDRVVALEPDVVTLDVEMPGMDGLATLDALMHRRPTPVIMVSAHTAAGAQVTLRALSRGAVDCVAKPGGPVSMDLGTLREELIAKVLVAAVSHPRGGRTAVPAGERAASTPPRRGGASAGGLRGRAVAIGASTGGVMALQLVLAGLPVGTRVPIFVAQHMPRLFTAPLAEMLGEAARLPAREARDGEPVQPGEVYVAPGGMHLTVVRDARTREVGLRVSPDPADAPLRPSVDLLFASVARAYGEGAVGVVLTGMGSDGTEGLAAIKRAGGVAVVQDETTSVVYGMPGSAVRAGLADVVAPVGRIGEEIARAVGHDRREGGS